MTSRNLLLGAAVATILVLPTAVLADAHSEIVNAEEHAGYAAVSRACPAYRRICITR